MQCLSWLNKLPLTILKNFCTFEKNTLKVVLSVKLYLNSWQSVIQVRFLTVIFKTLPYWYCFFVLLRYLEQLFIKSTDYLFQLVSTRMWTSLVSLTVQAQNKRKQFPLERKSVCSNEKKIFPKKCVCTNFSDNFHLQKKQIGKWKWFPLDRNSVSAIRNKKFL